MNNEIVQPGLEIFSIGVLLFTCIAVQAVILTALQRRFSTFDRWVHRHTSFGFDVLLLYMVILVVTMMHVLQACIWAWFFWLVVGIKPIDDAFYHSILSLTTMDDSSGVLPERWRLLGAAEGLTGWMVFSWSTAWTFLFLGNLKSARSREQARPGEALQSS